MLFRKYRNVTVLEYVILLVIIVLLILYVYMQHTAPNLQTYAQLPTTKHASWDDLLQHADNGDLVLMSGDTRGERVCRWFSHSMYSHVGILFREKHPQTGEDILYIWDADLGQGMKEGPRVMPLKDKLQKYRGFPYIMWRKCSPSKGIDRPTTENIMKIVEKYKDYEFDDYMWTWLLGPSWRMSTNSVFCSELVALTMQELGMLPNDKHATQYSPQDFAELSTYEDVGIIQVPK